MSQTDFSLIVRTHKRFQELTEVRKKLKRSLKGSSKDERYTIEKRVRDTDDLIDSNATMILALTGEKPDNGYLN